jgi:hypothetical protein
MKADKIIKNAKIFTANKDNPLATALVVKDGRFAYVGDEAGLTDYAGFSHNKPSEVYFSGRKVN